MDIWRNTVSDCYKLEDLTDTDIEVVKKNFGVNLPNTYIELLKKQNGGFIKFNALYTKDLFFEGNSYIHLDHLLGIKENSGILQTADIKNEWNINKGNIIIINGDGHTWIALDYNEIVNNEPSVIHIDTNEETKITKVFNNFDEMLQNLCIENVEVEFEGSIQLAKELLKSSDFEKIIDGLIMWENFFTGTEEINFFYNRLIELAEFKNENIKFSSTMIVYNLVEKNYVKDVNFLKIFTEKLTIEKNEHIQYFIEQIQNKIEALSLDVGNREI